MRDEVYGWLDAFYGRRIDRSVVRAYHGDLMKSSRHKIEEDFSNGKIRVLCCTVAYSIGVNPEAVKYVIQTCQCEIDEAMQKLGRANRCVKDDPSSAVFFWFLDPKYVGPAQPRPVRQYKYPKTAVRTAAHIRDESILEARRNSQFFQPALDMDSDASATSAASTPGPAPQPTATRSVKRKKKFKSKSTNPAVWRHENLVETGRYEIYNPPDGCYWKSLLAKYEEYLPDSCSNCIGCSPSKVQLAELPVDDSTATERPELVGYVRGELEKLALSIGQTHQCSILSYVEHNPIERVLSKKWRNKFAESYNEVATGKLFDWPWVNHLDYAQQVVNCVQRAIGQPVVIPASMSTPSLVMPNSSFSSVSSSAASPSPILRDVTNIVNSQRVTPRGSPSLMRQKGKYKVPRLHRNRQT